MFICTVELLHSEFLSLRFIPDLSEVRIPLYSTGHLLVPTVYEIQGSTVTQFWEFEGHFLDGPTAISLVKVAALPSRCRTMVIFSLVWPDFIPWTGHGSLYPRPFWPCEEGSGEKPCPEVSWALECLSVLMRERTSLQPTSFEFYQRQETNIW